MDIELDWYPDEGYAEPEAEAGPVGPSDLDGTIRSMAHAIGLTDEDIAYLSDVSIPLEDRLSRYLGQLGEGLAALFEHIGEDGMHERR